MELKIISPKPLMTESTTNAHAFSCGNVKRKQGLLHARNVSALTAGVKEEV